MAPREKFTSEKKLNSGCKPLITSNFKVSKHAFERG